MSDDTSILQSIDERLERTNNLLVMIFNQLQKLNHEPPTEV